MDLNFIDREEELAFLNQKWSDGESQLIILYGKRRVGKTELAVHFARGKPNLYFLCEKIPIHYQLKKITEILKDYFKDEFLPKEGFEDWETLFRYIKSRRQRIILIFDEFSYLAETDPSIPSSFQKGWDLYLKDSSVFLILAGSSISMMEQSALSPRAPLYGRRTGQILVKPFGFTVLNQMYPDKSFEEKLMIYSAVGGTPLYLNKFRKQSFWQTVKAEMLRKGEPLYEEVDFLLREELKEPRNYFAILESISLGRHKLSEIMNETGLDKGTVSRYIGILNQLHITKKEVPVTEKLPEKSRKNKYIIDDNFISFWFRFVFKNKFLLEENRVDEVLEKIKGLFLEVISQTYEKIAAGLLSACILKRNIPLKFQRWGKWWDKNNEIDLVALNDKTREIFFGEVKWTGRKIGIDVYQDLKKKSDSVEWGVGKRKAYFALFSRTGFTEQMLSLAQKENVILMQQQELKWLPNFSR